MKIYIVEGRATIDYEGYNHWFVKAFTQKAKATRLVTKLTKTAGNIATLSPSGFKYPRKLETIKKLDPEFGFDYSYSSFEYLVSEVELVQEDAFKAALKNVEEI